MGIIKRALLPFLVTTILIATVNAAALLMYMTELKDIIKRRVDHLSWSVPTTIYSAPHLIYVGQNIQEADLISRLIRLSYREVSGDPRPGEYSLHDNTLTIHTKPSLMPFGQRQNEIVTLLLDAQGGIKKIATLAHGESKQPTSYELEPEVLSYLFSDTIEKRQVIRLDEVPPLLLKAVIAIEDSRFHTHTGIDWRGVIRAVVHDIRAGQLDQGGSTLTQQLVKNFFLTHQRQLARKINEALMSLLMEQEYTKDKILEAYINEIYLGQDGSYPIHGVQEASLFYFSKQVADLDIAEVALLVAVIRGPNVYSPAVHPENTVKRRNLVLQKLFEEDWITSDEYQRALATPIPSTPRTRHQKRTAPFFVDFVVSELLQLLEQKSLSGQGLYVFTSLDPLVQNRSVQAFQKQMLRHPTELEGAYLLIDHRTGDILAMVGGKDYGLSQFNRAVQAKRQVGSLFKPIVYLQALIDSMEGRQHFTELTPLSDDAFTWEYEGQTWSPKNYDDKFHPNTIFSEALIKSYNIATARLASMIGLQPIIQLGIHLGFEGPIPPVPSVVLGSSSASMLEVATVYGTMANGCFQFRPKGVRVVYGQSREEIFRAEDVPEQVAPLAACRYMQHILRQTFTRGTAATQGSKPWAKDYAGKTGTTSQENDVWFAGFDDRWTLVTWLGTDNPQTTNLTGASGALPLWASIIDGIDRLRPKGEPMPLPPELSQGRVAAAPGDCRQGQPLVYFSAHPPEDLCP